jgi:hypothetical protein
MSRSILTLSAWQEPPSIAKLTRTQPLTFWAGPAEQRGTAQHDARRRTQHARFRRPGAASARSNTPAGGWARLCELGQRHKAASHGWKLGWVRRGGCCPPVCHFYRLLRGTPREPPTRALVWSLQLLRLLCEADASRRHVLAMPRHCVNHAYR